jgi:preprotein translocase subunit SecE
MSRFTNYLQDTKAEMKHVSWPTQRQAIVFTVLVIAFSVVVAVLLGFADLIFTEGLNWFVNR